MKTNLKNTVIFFIISFIWTWFFYLLIIILELNPYHGFGMVLLICGGCAPTFTGMIMAMVTYEKVQRIEYIKRTYQTGRIKLKWWIFIILVFPTVFFLSILLDIIMGGSLPEMTNLRAIIASPLSFFSMILLSFMSGPFSEELGWRGFALDALLNRYGFTKASVLIGLIWGVWHLPLYFMPQTWHGQMGFQFSGFWMFLIFTIGLSLMMSMVYINTSRSNLAAMLMHLSSNFTAQLLVAISLRVEIFKGLFVLLIGIGFAIFVSKINKKAVAERRDYNCTELRIL
ncbi:MAG: CPBP family intramembrane glutamic endopeptidase [Eubacteriales bacterium]